MSSTKEQRTVNSGGGEIVPGGIPSDMRQGQNLAQRKSYYLEASTGRIGHIIVTELIGAGGEAEVISDHHGTHLNFSKPIAFRVGRTSLEPNPERNPEAVLQEFDALHKAIHARDGVKFAAKSKRR